MEDQPKNIRQKLNDLGVSSDNVDDIELIIKFFATVNDGKDGIVMYETNAYDLMVLYTLVGMAASHEAFQGLGELQKEAIERFRKFCRQIWTAQGISVNEAEGQGDERTQEKREPQRRIQATLF